MTDPIVPADEAVLRLLKAAVPERSNELEVLWRRYQPAIKVAPDRAGVEMNATKERIRFDHKTLSAVWLMGFGGWKCLSIYAPAVMGSELLQLPIEEILRQDDDRGPLEADYRGLMSTANDLLTARNLEDVTWPDGIPDPGAFGQGVDAVEEKATFDLVCLAAAFVFLHEFRHVMHDADGSHHAELPDEEADCDVWARSFMTTDIAANARQSGHDYKAVHEKRSMALALGAAILYELTPAYDRFGSITHPAIADRMQAIAGGTGPSLDSNYWVFAACLLVGIHRRAGCQLPIISTGNRALVSTLIEKLR